MPLFALSSFVEDEEAAIFLDRLSFTAVMLNKREGAREESTIDKGRRESGWRNGRVFGRIAAASPNGRRGE